MYPFLEHSGFVETGSLELWEFRHCFCETISVAADLLIPTGGVADPYFFIGSLIYSYARFENRL
jgi:hypothetical protein